MATSLTKLITIRSVLSESRRLIKSQRRHFLSLGFLFLLPPIIIDTIIQSLLSDAVSFTFLDPIITAFGSLDHHDHQQPTPTPRINLSFLLAYLLFNSTLYLCATGSITYTAFHGFYGESIKPKSALNSIATSFFPLLATTLLSLALISLSSIVFALLFMAVIGGASLLGFQTEVSSPLFIMFGASMVVVSVLVVVHMQVSWSLASVVVVAESTWGFEALKRSRSLIKGRRWIFFCLFLIFRFLYVVFGWNITYNDSDKENNRKCSVMFLFVFQVLVSSSLRMLVKLYEMAADTALYVYCKAIHDEKVSGGEYVGLLTVDDEKV